MFCSSMCTQMCNCNTSSHNLINSNRYGEQVVETMASLLTDLKSDGIVLVMRTVEMVLRVLPGPGADLLRPLLPPLMLKVAEAECYPMLMSMYLSLLARLVLYTQDVFTWTLNQVSICCILYCHYYL